MNENSSVKLYYDFTDLDFSPTVNYYQLKQMDKNGNFSYSNVVVLKQHPVAPGLLAIYPSPATDVLNVKSASPGKQQNNLVDSRSFRKIAAE